MRTTVFSALVVVLTLLPTGPGVAEVRPAKVFSDHMVLQQELPINVFGSADPGESVTVGFNGATVSGKAGDDGRWLVKLPAMKADGKSHTLTVKGKNTIELKDVVLGEVWITSGQSNMGRGITIKEAIPGVRIFYRNKTVKGVFPCKHDYGQHTTAGWCKCSPEALAATPKPLGRSGQPTTRTEYGEVAVVFAKTLHEQLEVPVGVMNIAFAGSTASSWTPKPGLEKEYPFDKPIEAPRYNHIPGVMYRTQLHPVIPLTVRGVVWYQGEDDGRNQDYDQNLKKMIGKAPNWFQVASPLSKEVHHPSEHHYMLRLRQKMVSVKAEIAGKDTVVVHLPADMKEVFWVSFAWNALARHNLRNSEGLSAIPFRIWDGVPPRPE